MEVLKRNGSNSKVNSISPETMLAEKQSLRHENSENLELPNYGSLKEAIWFVCFLLVFVLTTLSGKNQSGEVYLYTERMKARITEARFPSVNNPNEQLQLSDIVQIDQIWNFLTGPLHQSIYQHTWYNNQSFNQDERGMVLSYNRLLGNVQVRSVRVKPDTCSVREEYRGLINYCYGPYSEENEQRTGFGPVLNSANISVAVAYRKAKEYFANITQTSRSFDNLQVCKSQCENDCGKKFDLDRHKYTTICSNSCNNYCNCFYIGILKNCINTNVNEEIPVSIYTYKWKKVSQPRVPTQQSTLSNSGYIVDLPANASKSLKAILKLKNDKFIDLATRVFVINLTVYNAYLELFNVVEIIFEVPPSGGVVSKYSYQSIDPYRYTTGFSMKLFTEIVFDLCVLLQLYRVLHGILRNGPSYMCSNFWISIETINTILLLSALGLQLTSLHIVYGIFGGSKPIILNKNEAPALHSISLILDAEKMVNALNATIMWFRVLKYCQASERMDFLMQMIIRASKNILFFMIIFLVFFFGFAQAGFMAFSMDVKSFSTLGKSFLTLFRSITGDLDYNALVKSSALFGPFFYISYYIVVLLVLLNVFLAILNDAYLKVSQEHDESDYLKLYPFSNGVFNTIKLWWKRNIGKNKLSKLNESVEGNRTNIKKLKKDLEEVEKEKLRRNIMKLETKMDSLIELKKERSHQLDKVEEILSTLMTNINNAEISKRGKGPRIINDNVFEF